MPRARSWNFYLLLVLDTALAGLALWLAYGVRFEGFAPPAIPAEHWVRFLAILLPFTALKIGAYFLCSLYRGMWRYTGPHDLINVAKAATTASLAMVAVLVMSHHFNGFSRSVFVLDWIFTLAFAAGLRLGIRLLYGGGWVRLPGLGALLRGEDRPVRRCVLLGAGEAANELLRDIATRAHRNGTRSPHTDIVVAAIFDDDPAKQGLRMHGIPVVGRIEALPAWVAASPAPIREALIAMPTASGEALRRVVAVCDRAGLARRTIPSLSQIADGRVSVKALRDVDLEDLLGREPVHLQPERIAGFLKDKTVLVTGAGGSIGAELCRQAVQYGPRALLLLDASESALYDIQMTLTHEFGYSGHTPLLGTLRDREWVRALLAEHRPDVILHAAAYKHVPMLELHPWQAVWNNILPTADLIREAREAGVGRLLVVSTDKAVRPANVMGASKRLTERIMRALSGGPTHMAAVRFGNVVGSAGSVVPLFRRQIERGGPVTVTHPEVTRYFMTVDEACQLVLQAGAMADQGEIYVLAMGTPVKVADMARDLIRLSGREPDRDIAIEYTGLRPGEKLYEELITEGEDVLPTDVEQIMVLGGVAEEWAALEPLLERLAQAADARDGEAVRALLREAVPEYRPAGEDG